MGIGNQQITMSLVTDDQSEEFKNFQESLGAEELSRDHVVYVPIKPTQVKVTSDFSHLPPDPKNDKMS